MRSSPMLTIILATTLMISMATGLQGQPQQDYSHSITMVYPNSSTWLEDSSEFNAAPYIGTSKANIGRPRCSAVAFAHDEADVTAAMNLFHQQQQQNGDNVFPSTPSPRYDRIQARSGRHSYLSFAANTSMQTSTMVIDVSNLTSIGVVSQVDLRSAPGFNPTTNPTNPAGEDSGVFAVKIGPGLRLFDLYDRLADQGYMFPGGTCPTVGISGFTLGGGMGFWAKRFGLAAQNLLGAKMVTYDQKTRKAVVKEVSLVKNEKKDTHQEENNDKMHQDDWDLLWGLRGGGNNAFGIVTELTVQVYPLPRYGTAWTSIEFPNKLSCLAALQLYQQIHLNGTLNPGGAMSYQMNIYSNYVCRVTAVGFNITLTELSQGMRNFLSIQDAKLSKGFPQGFDSNADGWRGMIEALGGCGNLTQCRDFTQLDYPNPDSPLRWGAMSSYLFQPFNNVTAYQLLETAANNKPDTGLSVIMLDGYGGAIRGKGEGPNFNSSSFPSTDALFHFQIISYFDPGELEFQQSKKWQTEVFKLIDGSQTIHRSYRNYPSAYLGEIPLAIKTKEGTTTETISAVERYYGADNLSVLRRLRDRWDPLGLFNYSQSV